MPHKFNTSRRHKFAKKKYRVTNWCGYNESLRNRGDLTVWITGDARKHWAAPRRRSRGGQPRYSDLAITMCLTLGMVYRLPLRQTQGLIRSISKLMLLEISVPDFSTLSRRGRGLSLPARPKIKITDPVHLAIDSTGLKVFDEGEWLQSKYNVRAKRKRWRKLHLGLNLVTGDIVCSDLTLDDVGDPTVLPDLLTGITDMVEANRFLKEVFLPQHNARFATPAEDRGTAFVPFTGALDDILCIHEERTVSNDNTVRYKRLALQIPAGRHRRHYVKARVRVHEYPDGTMAVFHGPRCLARYHADGQPIDSQTREAA